MAEVRAGQLPAPGAVDFQAVPLCLQKNAKDGEQGTQLADAQTTQFLFITQFQTIKNLHKSCRELLYRYTHCLLSIYRTFHSTHFKSLG